MQEEKLMKVSQVAEYLQMNRMTVYKLAKQGQLPGVKIGGEWRFDKEAIEQWLRGETKAKPPQEESTELKELKNKVLVVDDDAGIKELFRKIIKSCDCESIIASSGEECLQLIKKERPKVVLLDLKMEGMDGIDTLRQIKEYDKRTVVIIVTAYATMNTAIEAMKLGAYDYIAKPFDVDGVRSLVKEALKNRN